MLNKKGDLSWKKKGESKRLFLSLFIAIILCVGTISFSYASSAGSTGGSDSFISVVWNGIVGIFRSIFGGITGFAVAGENGYYSSNATCSISGIKYNDSNANRIKDEGENLLSGWVINLYNGDRTQFLGSTTTNENGFYEFSSLTSDEYIVCELMKVSWVSTAPNAGINSGDGNCHLVTFSEGNVVSGIDFGNYFNYTNCTISGIKWHDSNANGNIDTGEEPLSNWLIQLKEGDTIIDTAVTDENGEYSFNVLTQGTYSVCEQMKDGWTSTDPIAGETSGYNNCWDGLECSEPVTSHTGKDFGNDQEPFCKFYIQKKVDANANGIYNDGGLENQHLPAWVFDIKDTSNNRLTLIFTDSEGIGDSPSQDYIVKDDGSSLECDKSYIVDESVRPGWTAQTNPQTVTCGSPTSDGFCYINGASDLDDSFVEFKNSYPYLVYNVGGRVYGSVIEGASITIDGQDVFNVSYSNSTLTDSSGDYEFLSVPGGIYNIAVSANCYEPQTIVGENIISDRTIDFNLDSVDCSTNNLPAIATCTNGPDGNPYTYDTAPAFVSTCDTLTGTCSTGTYSYTHTCDVAQCGAECDSNDDCASGEVCNAGCTCEPEVCLDDDNDGVCNADDKCPATVAWYATQGLRPNHYDNSNMDLATTYGCSCEQILYCKPGANNGEQKWGCTEGTMNVWTNQIGWAPDCQVNGIVATEGEAKSILEDTDNAGMIDPLDGDNDNDGIPDGEDSEDDSTPSEPGQQGTGKPDWWCDKHPTKC
ncbi:hypothetical protein KY343_00550 [Candidatus Woesearchaeota archaeon]|nr:hypothetical protein [Candidatus Woesearchaeota archaeon]